MPLAKAITFQARLLSWEYGDSEPDDALQNSGTAGLVGPKNGKALYMSIGGIRTQASQYHLREGNQDHMQTGKYAILTL